MRPPSRIEGILLDIDGTLVDSNDAHAEAFRRAFAEMGHEFSFSRIRSLIGMGSDHLIPLLTRQSAESEESKMVLKRKAEIFRAYFLPHLKAFPYARSLVKHFQRMGLEVAIVSSAEEDDIQALLKVAGVERLISLRISGDDVDRSKPSPDPVEQALKKVDLEPSRVLFIGDTPYDVEAAEKAGVRTIAFTSGGWGPGDLRGAVAVFPDAQALLQALQEKMVGEHAYLAPLFFRVPEAEESTEPSETAPPIPLRERLKGLLGVFGIRTAEEPSYAIRERDGAKEIRTYEPLVTATLTVNAHYRKAMSRAFRALLGYAFGRNAARATLGMTLPILQERKRAGWTLAFILPKRFTLRSAPEPLFQKIHLEERPSQTVAAIQYSGWNSPRKIRKKARELLRWIAETGSYRVTSVPRSAQYDPPNAFPFFRRNEVQVTIEPLV